MIGGRRHQVPLDPRTAAEKRLAERSGPVTTRTDASIVRDDEPMRRRTPEERRRDRAAGVDRHGRPLPRVKGTNPRAVRQRASQGASRPAGTAARVPSSPAATDQASASATGPEGPPRRAVHPAAPVRDVTAAPGGTGAPPPDTSFPPADEAVCQAGVARDPRQGVDSRRAAGQGDRSPPV